MWGQRCVPLREITVPSIIFYLYTVRRMYHFVLFCWLTHNLDSVPGAQGPQETPLRWWYHFHKYVPWIGELFHIGKQNLEVARWFTATWGQRWLAFSAGKLGQWHPVFFAPVSGAETTWCRTCSGDILWANKPEPGCTTSIVCVSKILVICAGDRCRGTMTTTFGATPCHVELFTSPSLTELSASQIFHAALVDDKTGGVHVIARW